MNRKTLVILLTSTTLMAPISAVADGARTSLQPVPKPGHIIAGTPAPVAKPKHLKEVSATLPVEKNEASREDQNSAEETIEERMARILPQTVHPEVKEEPENPETFGPPMPSQEQLEAMAQKFPSPLSLDDFNENHFADDKAALEKAFTAAGSREPDASKARLELSRFYLAHRMVPEGHSILQSLSLDNLDEQDLLDYKAMSTAFAILDPRRRSEDHFSIDSDEYKESWVDYPFWAALHHINEGNGQSSDFLPAAFDAVQNYPQGYVASFVPTLLEEALKEGQWGLAKNMALKLETIPGMKDSSTFQFLIGMAAERTGRQLDAFDAYRKAALKDDLYAQKARIAILDLSVKTQAMPLEDARTFLEVHRRSWRGDNYEVEILKRLAVVTGKLGDDPASLSALGDIFTMHPTSPIAEDSKRKANLLLEEVYDKGKEGKISLSEFTRAHNMISRKYHYFEGFSKHHEAYATHLMDLGATAAAAKEFGEAADYLDVAVDLNLFDDIIKDDAMELRLKQATALVRGGQFIEAAQIIRDLEDFQDPDLNEAKSQLSTEIFANLDNPDKVIESAVRERTSRYIRLVAEAYWAQSNWAKAKDHYLELQRVHPDSFGRKDAINLLLSAHRDLDRETALNIAEIFPSIIEEPEYQRIANEINKLPIPLTSLSETRVEDRVNQAEGALSLIDETRK